MHPHEFLAFVHHADETAEAGEDEIKSAVMASESVQKHLEEKEPKMVVVTNRRLVSIVM